MKRRPARKRRSDPSPEQIARRNQIIDAHEWFGMATFRFPKGCSPKNEKTLVSKLCKLIDDLVRYRDLHDVAFLVSRENGKKEGLHYHVLFTSRTLDNLPEELLDRFRDIWIKRVGAKHNQGRYFQWDHLPTKPDRTRMAEYVKKTRKGKFPVLRIPRAWSGIILSPRQFHTRGLGHGAGLRGDEQEEDLQVGRIQSGEPSLPSRNPQSVTPVSPPVDTTHTTNWSFPNGSGLKLPPSANGNSRQNADPVALSVSLAIPALTNNTTGGESTVLTLSGSDSHTFSTCEEGSVLTRSQATGYCETCEYHGLLVGVIPDLTHCPLCGNPWDMCCPF